MFLDTRHAIAVELPIGISSRQIGQRRSLLNHTLCPHQVGDSPLYPTPLEGCVTSI